MSRVTLAGLQNELGRRVKEVLAAEARAEELAEKLKSVEHQRDALKLGVKQLKAVATHYKNERDRIDAYLGAVLDSMAPRFIEAEPTDKQPGCSPVFMTKRPDTRIERIEPPNRPHPTEPAQDSDYYHNLKRIDWESF